MGLKREIIYHFPLLLFLFFYTYLASGVYHYSWLIFYLLLLIFSYILGEFSGTAQTHFGLNYRTQIIFLCTVVIYWLLANSLRLYPFSFQFLIPIWVYLSFLAPIIGLFLRRLFPVPALLVSDQSKGLKILKWWGFDCRSIIKKGALVNWLKSSSDNLGRVNNYQTILIDITNPHFGDMVLKLSEYYLANFVGIKSFNFLAYLLNDHSRILNFYPDSGINYRLKRLVDIFLSLFILLIIAPIFLFILLCIKIDTPGPVFYKHKRLGRNMKEFFLLKLRTMHQDADKRLKTILEKNPELKKEFAKTFKLKKDPRVTRIGRLLRPFSFDEIPQVLNILRGEMSWVGPRPIVKEEVPYYKDYSLLMFRVLPGATGLWQISGRSQTSYAKRVELDTLYVKNWSYLKDLKILLKTIPAVLSKRGAY